VEPDTVDARKRSQRDVSCHSSYSWYLDSPVGHRNPKCEVCTSPSARVTRLILVWRGIYLTFRFPVPQGLISSVSDLIKSRILTVESQTLPIFVFSCYLVFGYFRAGLVFETFSLQLLWGLFYFSVACGQYISREIRAFRLTFWRVHIIRSVITSRYAETNRCRLQGCDHSHCAQCEVIFLRLEITSRHCDFGLLCWNLSDWLIYGLVIDRWIEWLIDYFSDRWVDGFCAVLLVHVPREYTVPLRFWSAVVKLVRRTDLCFRGWSIGRRSNWLISERVDGWILESMTMIPLNISTVIPP